MWPRWVIVLVLAGSASASLCGGPCDAALSVHACALPGSRALPMWCRCVRTRSAWPAPRPCSRPALWLGACPHSALLRPLLACRLAVGAGRAGQFAGRARSALQFLPCHPPLATRSATVQHARWAWACAHSLCLSLGLPVACRVLAGFVYVCRAAFGALSHVGWSRALSVAFLPPVRASHGGTWVRRRPRPYCIAVVRLCAHRMSVASPPGRPGSAV